MKASIEDPNSCFKIVDLRDSKKSVDLCVSAISIKPTETMSDARNKWIEDIKLFQEGCREKPIYVDGPDALIQKKLQALENESFEKKMEKIKERDSEKNNDKIQKKVELSANNAIHVLLKYNNYFLTFYFRLLRKN